MRRQGVWAWVLLLWGGQAWAGPDTTNSAPAATIHANGLAAFRLGQSLEVAARLMAKVDKSALQMGPGCDGREQSVVTLMVAGRAMTVMAMADARGRIAEVVASAPHQGPPMDEATCHQQGARWAQQAFVQWGPGQARAPMSHGAAKVASVSLGGAKVESRWFAGGKSCDLSLHFGQAASSTGGL